MEYMVSRGGGGLDYFDSNFYWQILVNFLSVRPLPI